jgi:hypothetical protein
VLLQKIYVKRKILGPIIKELITEKPTLVFFLVPGNLSNHMDRKVRAGDIVLVKSREMTGGSQTLPWWLEG